MYDAIIVGAGIMGCATAYWLSRAGNRVLVLDKHAPGHELASSSDESRAVRHQYRGRDFYTDMVAQSLHLWKSFEQEVARVLYHETGTLMLQSKPGHAALERGYDGLQRLGYQPEWLDAADLKVRFPQFDHVDSGFFTEGCGGFIRAREAVVALAQQAISLGAKFHTGCRVARLATTGDYVSHVETDDGQKFEAAAYIVVAGAWTEKLLPHLHVPVKSTAQRLHYLRPKNRSAYSYPKFVPFAIMDTQFYGFPVHWNASLKIADDQIGPTFDPDADRELPNSEALAKLRRFLQRHLPELKDAEITYAKTCAYSMTPDTDFIIDAIPGTSNAFVGAGFSGHGFKFGILIGQVLGDLVRHGQTELDIRPFRLDRDFDTVKEHW